MWLMKQMAEKRVARYDIADKGTVALSEGGRVNVRASGEHVGVPVAAPYGIAYVPPEGADAVLLPASGGSVCIGSFVKDKGLEAGEIMLYSAGGAELILQNDGTILANGKVIAGGA